jgi:Leucine-rich repeat (LRR) protein
VAGLQNLQYLWLGKGITDEGLRHLAGLKSLRLLTLSDTKVRGAGIRHLAGLKNLTMLDVPITDEALRALHEVGLLHALGQAHTNTSNRPTNSEQVVALKFSSQQSRLITDEGLKHLASFKNLTELDLNFSPVTDAGLKHLAGLDKLTTLSLFGCRAVTAAGLEHLAGLKNLAALTLDETRVTGEGVKYLIGLKNLTRLSVPLTDGALEALHAAGMLHRLSRSNGANGRQPTKDDEIAALDLSNGQLTGHGLKFVAKLPNLATLDLRGAAVNDAWLDDLRRTRPNCKIIK